VSPERDDEAMVVAWYDVHCQQWRWRCDLCGTEHGTTSIEEREVRRRDLGWPGLYEGPVQYAMRSHIDRVHPDDDIAIEIREPG
jgi:hypothetical protein